MSDFETALADMASVWPALLPPNRVSVSQGAASALKIVRPGGGSGPWRPELTPYMIEPADTLASRRHSAVCFVGPSQAGKTVALGEGWLSHVVTNDPGDMAIIQMTEDKAREYSRQRIARAIANSPKLAELIGAASRDDNIHDKAFRNGMQLKIGWPTAANLSSTSYRYIFGTDYDRWPDNIDGEGDGFTLMLARTRTFLSRGMACVESSPGRSWDDPHWRPSTPHEAPPTTGILGIYNRSDRRRFYWRCPHCGEPIQASPGLGIFNLPDERQLLEDIRTLDIEAFSLQYARAVCPAGCLILPEHRESMNLAGRWLADGLTMDARGRISGTPRESSIAGFWLGGVAAAYLSWRDLLRKYLQALLEYALTGSELPLQTTTNTDQGVPYMPRAVAEVGQEASTPEGRADPDIQRRVVPGWARFLTAQVDVQGGKNARFIVQVHAVGPYQETQLIDRYAITESEREGYGGNAPVDPASHPEDWDLLTKKVVQATYPTEDPDVEMRVKLTLVDSGGEDGVTGQAYAWWRRLKRQNLHRKARVTKGAEGKYDWWIRETMVGGPNQTHGDVPLQLLNANLFKDEVDAALRRPSPGPNYYHFPKPKSDKNPDGWLLSSFFEELRAEVRLANGKWSQIRKRNEALDLCYMGRAACMMLGANKASFWESPPAWARPIAEGNSELVRREERRAEKAPEEKPKPSGVSRARRSSSYLG